MTTPHNLLYSGIDVRNYWPWPDLDRPTINYFDNGVVHTYDRLPNGWVRLREMRDGEWQDDWFMANTSRGVLEVADNVPKGGLQKLLFWASFVTNTYEEGQEIYWGNELTLVPGPWIVRPFKTAGIFKQAGAQAIRFDAIIPSMTIAGMVFTNVLQMEYSQSWGLGTPEGAMLWLAPGRGPIRFAWTKNNIATGESMSIISMENSR